MRDWWAVGGVTPSSTLFAMPVRARPGRLEPNWYQHGQPGRSFASCPAWPFKSSKPRHGFEYEGLDYEPRFGPTSRGRASLQAEL